MFNIIDFNDGSLHRQHRNQIKLSAIHKYQSSALPVWCQVILPIDTEHIQTHTMFLFRWKLDSMFRKVAILLQRFDQFYLFLRRGLLTSLLLLNRSPTSDRVLPLPILIHLLGWILGCQMLRVITFPYEEARAIIDDLQGIKT